MVLHMPHPYVNIRIAPKIYEYVSFNTFEWFKMIRNVFAAFPMNACNFVK